MPPPWTLLPLLSWSLASERRRRCGGTEAAYLLNEKLGDFLDRTLALVPRYRDALLNKAKAWTYSGRYADSLQVLDQLLAQNSLVGDARYWRALNEEALSSYDDAWADIELANKHLFDAAVPRLAGIIAYHRKQLDVSRDRFELSRRRNRRVTARPGSISESCLASSASGSGRQRC